MSEIGDRAKLEFVVKLISDIELIVERHGNVQQALGDIEGQYAILMCLMQVGESLSRIGDLNIKKALPVKEASSVRNFIAHDYGGVNLELIEEIIVIDLPIIKTTIQKYMNPS